ncbi:D-alanyl-D-alanine carboxypeptidase [Ruminococcus sp. YE71]|uniref:M15 family metallopeptidase n=1 Tax=unclassified Ruminococcus TaxID=2608920 RepID=UPI00088346FE|nr:MULTISPECIES: M15 family metallopeptidase [unclassified Ruminococcus]SDA15411.1 D-alanyl-D-alanine carboxypeptidase [Ruminococcus sp. YE78]SFW22492.1 D-alanyl-D-alanine carboxypeptidase [Ruminococcus sp. YE71]
MKDEYSHDFDFVRYTDWREHSRRYTEPADQRENADTVTFRDDEDDFPPEPQDYQDPQEYREPEQQWNEDAEPEWNSTPEWSDETVQEEYAEPVYNVQEPVYQEDYQQEYEFDRERALEQIRLAKIKRERADQLARDRLHAEIFLVVTAIVIVMLIIGLIVHVNRKKNRSDTFTITSNTPTAPAEELKDLPESMSDAGGKGKGKGSTPASEHEVVQQGGITYVDGIMIVNKTYGLPSTYDPGLDPQCEAAFNQMAAAAWSDGVTLWICSGYRSYTEQDQLFDGYATARGLEGADEVSARPGHSEHQTGLSIDVNTTDFTFADTAESQWLQEHCAEYGFIIRFPKGKEKLTGYEYEPWHIRYVGVENAQKIKATGKCLEEFLGVTSDYELSPDNELFKKKYEQYSDSSSEETQSADDNNYDNGGYTDYNNYDYGTDNSYTDYNTYDNGYDNGYTDYNADYNTYDYNYGY